MPSVTQDGRSFLIDGRRVWLVSGRIPFARVPRESWAERIHAAKHMGLNAIESPVIWNRHEIRPGKFDFSGDNDLRHFVDLCAKAGMYVTLGLGPYIGSGWEFGGLPPWLAGTPIRTNSQSFLEATSRFIAAVAEQIKGWQVTAPGTGGPIVMLRCETGWTCGHDSIGDAYLGELTRYIRESGLNVPLVNSNNLWKSIEGQVDGWASADVTLATLRQLTAVRPAQPRVVIELPFASPSVWGREPTPASAPHVLLRRLAEITAAGGQFNLTSFCGGTNFGFTAGRLADGPDAVCTTSNAHGSILREDGELTPAYRVLRRLVLASSKFARVFSNLDPTFLPICVEPGGEACAVIHATGAQGGVAFVFGDEPHAAKPRLRSVPVLMGDGTSMSVPVTSNGVAWCFFGVTAGQRSRIDYTNLSALGMVGQAVVLFAPMGVEGVISVNGSPVEVLVPDDATPVIIDHEGLTLVVVNEEQTDRIYFTDDGVYLGVGGVRPDGTPMFPDGEKSCTFLGADGKRRTLHAPPPPKRTRVPRPAPGPWSQALVADYVDGSSARFAAISGQTDLTSLGCPVGYGWYRMTFTSDRPRHIHVAYPFAGDRLHFFSEGKSLGIMGLGPGAEPSLSLHIHKGEQSLVILAENAGRMSEGVHMGEPKGLLGPAMEVAPLRLAKPELEPGLPLDPLAFRAPIWDVAQGDTTAPDRITWRLPHKHKSPVLMTFSTLPETSLLVVNDKVIQVIDRSGPWRVLLEPELLGRSMNLIQVAVLGSANPERVRTVLAGSVKFEDATPSLLGEASIAFAKWEQAAPSAFSSKPARHPAGTPAWWRSSFDASPAHGRLWLEPLGMTKGQVYVNGRHLGRYFIATASGRRVPPQSRYLVPASWLKADGPNELVMFDEHGASPAKVRLVR
ncbi:MAG: hypothetical protein HBSAPP03_21290 [Phycisphaerae bacterium]|nr:MAG: hypothetical protein HBSAPP03_21290 [Phycisphaerae bacterium]